MELGGRPALPALALRAVAPVRKSQGKSTQKYSRIHRKYTSGICETHSKSGGGNGSNHRFQIDIKASRLTSPGAFRYASQFNMRHLTASQGGLTQSEWKGCPQNRWIKLRGVLERLFDCAATRLLSTRRRRCPKWHVRMINWLCGQRGASNLRSERSRFG